MAKLPDHLFVSSSDGHLYDTRNDNWSKQTPLRSNYRMGHRDINSAADLKAVLRNGAYTDLGGYPMYFITRDGAALSFDSTRANLRDCLGAIAHPDRFENEWRIVACEINYEMQDLYCEHSNERIDPAYDDKDSDI